MAQIKACIFSFFMRNIPQEAIMAQRAVVASSAHLLSVCVIGPSL